MAGIAADGWGFVALRREIPGFQIVSPGTKNIKRIEKPGKAEFVLRRPQMGPRKTDNIRSVDGHCCGWSGFAGIKDVPKFRVELQIQIISQVKKNIKRIEKPGEVEYLLRRPQVRPRKTEKIKGLGRHRCGWLEFRGVEEISASVLKGKSRLRAWQERRSWKGRTLTNSDTSMEPLDPEG